MTYARPASTLIRQRAFGEIAEIEAVANKHAHRWAVVPTQTQEPVGVERLAMLATHAAETA
jgi:arsenite/tail-anchored protein-transporting ATPase